jgi:hypothetical protein
MRRKQYISDDGIADCYKLKSGDYRAMSVKTSQLISVAYPYFYSNPRLLRPHSSLFVRCLESHIYARDHNVCNGFGTQDHIPTFMEPFGTAVGKWLPGISDQAPVRAQSILCYPQAEREVLQIDRIPVSARQGVANRVSGVCRASPVGRASGVYRSPFPL